jgi:serine protease Do
MVKLLSLFLLLNFAALTAADEWPKSLDKISGSLCLVEYYQPIVDFGEMEEQGRIKRNLIGILVSDDGLVVTTDQIYKANLDILQPGSYYGMRQQVPENITVAFDRKKPLKATFLGKDEELNLAFLKIEQESQLPSPVQFDTRADFRLGERIFILEFLGDDYDNELFISQLNINGLQKKPRLKILTSGSDQSLSAGGLVVDAKGKAVGIVTRSSAGAKMRDYSFHDFGGASSNLTEISLAKQFAPLFKNPPVMSETGNGGGKSWIGVQMQILTDDMAEYWNLNGTQGIIVNGVLSDSPAEKAGLQVGDIITKIAALDFNNDDRENLEIFRNYVRNLPEGPVELEVYRSGKAIMITVGLESAPKSQHLAEEYSDDRIGLSVKELTRDFILSNDLEFDTQGVWVSRIEDAGMASLGGVQLNDMIIRINDRPVGSLDDFRGELNRVLEEKPEYFELFVHRDGRTRFLFVNTNLEDSGI